MRRLRLTLALAASLLAMGCGDVAMEREADGAAVPSTPPASAGGSAAARTPPPSPASSPAHSPSSPRPSSSPSSSSPPRELPSRVVVADFGIDLPVISGDETLPGNPPDYPLCDVAQYLTTYRYLGRDGATTWIYSHARTGMFLPLLDESRMNDGAALLGKVVEIYSTTGQVHRYRVVDVLRHATDRGVAADVPEDSRRLVLQTSEGPRGTVPKLQVVAEFMDSMAAPPGVSQPSAEPRVCYIP